MNLVQKHATLPVRSLCARRPLPGEGSSAFSAFSSSSHALERPSTAAATATAIAGPYGDDDSDFFAAPSVKLFGTIGKSPRIVRKTSHSKGGSFRSLGRSATGGCKRLFIAYFEWL